MSAIILVTRYRDTTVNHRHFTFQYSASQFNRIRLIQEDQRVNYKYCPTCNICYKKSYYNSHKKNKFHKVKQNVINDAKDKRLNEFSLERTINVHLEKLLKNNDASIGNIICGYLKDTCNDCKEETSNPSGYVIQGEEVNVCQHCRSKYRRCCDSQCNFIGTIKTWNHCSQCLEIGCGSHMKRVNGSKKFRCLDCSHNEVDKLFVRETTINDQVKHLKEMNTTHSSIMRHRAKENKQLKIDLIMARSKINKKNNDINDRNERINAKDNEISDLRQELAYMKRKEEQRKQRKQRKIDRIVGRIV